MDFQLKDVLQNLGNILVMFLILRHFLYKPVTKYMKDRDDRIQSELKRASDSVAHAEEARRKINTETENAKKEAESIMQKSSGEAQHAAERILEEAKVEAEQVIEEARKAGQEEKDRAVAQANNEIIDIAVSIAQKILKREISLEDNKGIINDFLNEVDGNAEGSA